MNMSTTNHIVAQDSGAVGLALMGLGIALFIAMAAPQIAKADDAQNVAVARDGSRAQHVSLAGLDLSTPEGMRTARARVQAAAHNLCAQVEDMNDLSRHANYLACMDEATSAALQQIQPASMVAATKAPARDSR
jgi:UrcA family protein